MWEGNNFTLVCMSVQMSLSVQIIYNVQIYISLTSDLCVKVIDTSLKINMDIFGPKYNIIFHIPEIFLST